jgi:chemotaxis protein CheD
MGHWKRFLLLWDSGDPVDNDTTIRVKIADMAVKKDQGIIITVGLGSCIGIALYDPASRLGGLSHILLPDSSQFKNLNKETINVAKFADTAIPSLVEAMARMGAKKPRLQAKIAGGSQLFAFDKTSMSVGEKNIAAVIKTLKGMGIPILKEDVGGNYGRTMRLFVETGKVLISTVGKGEKEL